LQDTGNYISIHHTHNGIMQWSQVLAKSTIMLLENLA
jgi:hypothetical protein